VGLLALAALLSAALLRPSSGNGPPRLTAAAPAAAPAAPSTARRTAAGDLYAYTGVGQLAPATRGVPYRLYVPESAGNGVDVIDPSSMRIVAHFRTGHDPQHVVPSYDLRTLYVTNDLANTLTPFDPRTSRPSGPSIPVPDPYNMYFAPGGREAIVVAEARASLEFYDAHSFAPRAVLRVDCAGVDHADFTADGRVMLASCEFAHRMVRIDVAHHAVAGYLDMPSGSSPQDVRISADSRLFYVADKLRGGVHLIDARQFKEVGFLPTGKDAHGLYPSRDGKSLYVSNRGSGTISVIDFAKRRVVQTWRLPGGGSPDMGGVSPDGRVLWLTGRYDATVYKISTVDGRLLGQVRVPRKPHGMAVWPQPGRFSLGHTGNMR